MRLLRYLPGLLIAAIAAMLLAANLIPRGSAAPVPAAPQLQGTLLTGKPAPSFHLRDQLGREISPAGLRGHAWILTFMEAHCTETCRTVAETIRHTLDGLGKDASRVQVVVVSTDPTGDTPAAVRQFSSQHHMYTRWHYLTGTRAQLVPVWHDYYIYAPPANAPARIRDAHTSATFLMDRAGKERVLMGGPVDPAALDTDVRLLAGLPAHQGGELAVPAPSVGHPAPAFTLRDLQGRPVSLQVLHGRRIILNFWATWCKPCRQEIPRLAAWSRTHPVTVLGIDQQEGRSTVAAYARQLHIPYTLLLDADGSVSATYSVGWLPESLVLDSHGVVRFVKLGGISQSELQQQAG